MDPQSTAKIGELCLELRNKVTILIVTHNIAQASRISGYSAFMYLVDLAEASLVDKLDTISFDAIYHDDQTCLRNVLKLEMHRAMAVIPIPGCRPFSSTIGLSSM